MSNYLHLEGSFLLSIFIFPHTSPLYPHIPVKMAKNKATTIIDKITNAIKPSSAEDEAQASSSAAQGQAETPAVQTEDAGSQRQRGPVEEVIAKRVKQLSKKIVRYCLLVIDTCTSRSRAGSSMTMKKEGESTSAEASRCLPAARPGLEQPKGPRADL